MFQQITVHMRHAMLAEPCSRDYSMYCLSELSVHKNCMGRKPDNVCRNLDPQQRHKMWCTMYTNPCFTTCWLTHALRHAALAACCSPSLITTPFGWIHSKLECITLHSIANAYPGWGRTQVVSPLHIGSSHAGLQGSWLIKPAWCSGLGVSASLSAILAAFLLHCTAAPWLPYFVQAMSQLLV